MAQDFGCTVMLGKQAHSRLRNCFYSMAVRSKDPSDLGIIESSFLSTTPSLNLIIKSEAKITMKTPNYLQIISVLSIVLFSGTAFAYNAGNADDKCKIAKFSDFNPPAKTADTPVSETEAESEVSFKVSGYADPTSIRVIAKKQQLKLDITDRNSFYLVKTKLPASLSGKYVRFNIKAQTHTGGCIGKGGWLFKVKPAEKTADAEPKETPKTAATPAPKTETKATK